MMKIIKIDETSNQHNSSSLFFGEGWGEEKGRSSKSFWFPMSVKVKLMKSVTNTTQAPSLLERAGVRQTGSEINLKP